MSGKKKPINDGIVANDGSYLGSKRGQANRAKKIQADFDKAWDSQKELLKTSSVKLYKDKNSIGLQWQSYVDYNGSRLASPKRLKKGLNLLDRGKYPLTADAVNRAIAIAKEIDLKIQANAFSWRDYPQWLPKELQPKVIKPKKLKTVAEWIEEYEQDYWNTRDKENYKDERNWKNGYLLFLSKIKDWSKLPSKEVFDEAIKSYPESRKRNECCTRIKYFARFCGLTNYDPKELRLKQKQVKVKAKPKRELSEKEVEHWYNQFPKWQGIESSKSHWQLWQWMYGIQATYGFRNHETLNIFNLDCEYTDDNGIKYYPFTDTEKNPRGIIYTEGKGVKRAAFLPQPIRWIEQFKLREIPKRYYDFQKELSSLSDYEKAKKKECKLHTYSKFLYEHGFTFTAYNLRHAHNVKSHGLGIPPSLIAQNLGHSIQMNQTIYLSSMGVKSCLEALDNWEKKNPVNTNSLTTEEKLSFLQQENEQLKALEQQLLESIKS